MNTDFPDDVAEYGRAARRRFDRFGGPAAALAAETAPAGRADAGRALVDIGLADLDPRADTDDLLAAAVLCRAAGAALLPWPVVESLLAVDGTRLALVDPDTARIDHGDLDIDELPQLPGGWLAADLRGALYDVDAAPRTPRKLGPFVVAATLTPTGGSVPPADVDLHLVLGSLRVLGGLEAALDAVTAHVRDRTQFGKRLADFQAVRFALADAGVGLSGLAELAKFTLSRMDTVPEGIRRSDAIALRLKACDTGRTTLRTVHQLYGASGFCDETDVSVIDRHLQPLLRLPVGADGLARLLAESVADDEFEHLFSASDAPR